MNQWNWVEDTLQDAKEKVISRTTSKTHIPRKNIEKRQREEDSPSVTKFLASEFNIYTKQNWTSSKIDFLLLEETWGTILLSGLQNLNFDY